MDDIKTIGDLITALKQYPEDMPVVYDYGLSVELEVIFEDSTPTLNIS